MSAVEGPGRALVEQALGGLRQPALVLHDLDSASVAAALPTDRTVLHPVAATVPGVPRRWPAVVLVARDRLSLRRTASLLPPLGRTRLVICWLLEDTAPLPVCPRPEWPALVELRGRAGPDGAVTLLRHDAPVGAHVLLSELARAASPARTGSRGLVLGTAAADAPTLAPPADPGLVVAATAAGTADPERPVPPDVVLAADPALALPDHPVLGRAPVVVADPLLLSGPLDEGVLNPAGFRRTAARAAVELAPGPDGTPLLAGGALGDVVRVGEVTPRLLGLLRDHRGVHVSWSAGDDAATARVVAALAMAGVPLRSGPLAPPVTTRLGPGLSSALDTPADLDDDLDREEHSIRLRRAALLHHSALGWRARTAARAGVRFAMFPPVSVLLPATGPQDLERMTQALEAQSVTDLELVGPGKEALAGAIGDLALLLPGPADLGPDLVLDLLLARHHSGAAVVEAPDELMRSRDGRVVRRAVGTERAVTALAGGPTLVDRRLLGDVPTGQPCGPALHRRGHLLYRSHGLGHVASVAGDQRDQLPGAVDEGEVRPASTDDP